MGYYWNNYCDINVLEGKTLVRIEQSDDEIKFVTSDGDEYLMFHNQDCCEHVYIDDIDGNLQDLLGSPVISAYESCNEEEPDMEYSYESYTWTFYRITAGKTTVCIRWFGSSNGYYSESVTFMKVN